MGHLASYNTDGERSGSYYYRATRRHALKRRRRPHASRITGQDRRRAALCTAICLALLLSPLASTANLYAQSGRNKKPTTAQPNTTRTPPAQQARPRRAAAEATPTPAPNAPARSAQPQVRVPLDLNKMGEPPPWPTPKPVQTPAAPAASTTVQPSSAEEVDAEDVVRINSNLVTVPASVIDALGHPVTDLKLEDFELRVDGQPKPISELGSSETPVVLALLFDNSSSLTTARDFEKQAAIRFFRSVIRPMDLAAVYSVSTYPTLAQPLTNDVRTLVRTIERFGKPEGATALFDAVVQAANYLRPHQGGRKVIIIVSDGADTISEINFDAALQRAQAADCQIYAVQTGHIENANLRDLAAERRLQDFAGQTGGAVYVPRGTSDLDAAFAQISADLAQQYVLSYYPADERRDNLFRTISVRVVTRPNLRVRARKGYYPRKVERYGANQQTGTGTEFVASLERPLQASADVSSEAPREASNSSTTTPRASMSDISIGTGSGPTGPPEPDSLPRSNRDAQTSAATKSSNSPPPVVITRPAPTPAPPQAEQTPAPAATPAPASSSTPKAPVSGGVLNGKAISLPMPLYPEAARNARAYGTVSVEVTIDEQGRVVAARAVSGHALLHGPAVAAARRARFAPTKLSGQPVKVTGIINYNFNLTQ